jgi:sigma-B regulation protein RsbU (phosphoserine phosphatase)
MTDITTSRIDMLVDSLQHSIQQAEQLQTVLERVLRALTKRGVQVLIDFEDMTRTLRQNLDSVEKNSKNLTTQVNQLRELVNTSALLTSTLDLEQVLNEVMDTVIQLTGAERAYLMLQQNEADELKVQSARNWNRETISKEDVTFSHGIIQTAIDQGTPLVTTNAQSDARFQGMKSVFVNDLRSAVVIPLILKGKTVGVLYVDNRIEQGVFSQENIPLLTAFANQAAIAISNARLFEKIKDDLQQAQREVQRLRIEIDQNRVQEKVSEITESDYFVELTEKAKTLRLRGKK